MEVKERHTLKDLLLSKGRDFFAYMGREGGKAGHIHKEHCTGRPDAGTT